jgi:Arc/MetJ-type ribon-helix-helix transcriptional regulator
VRLTEEEEALLESFRKVREFSNRSEAVRALVRESVEHRELAFELPATLRAEVESLVEDGVVRSRESAIDVLVTLGLGELERTHDRVNQLRAHARSEATRRETRRRADREGRGLLGR